MLTLLCRPLCSPPRCGQGPISTFRSHALAIGQSTDGDRNEYPQLWILKPQQSYNQMGISMVRGRLGGQTEAQALV